MGLGTAVTDLEFEAALNVQIVSSTCESESADLVTCRVQATDDLSLALGVSTHTDVFEISFDEAGQIVELAAEMRDGGVREVFTHWAWGIAYPGLCDAPAQCAGALMDVVDEYKEAYAGAVVASYIAAYNAGDVESIMSLFTEDSVVEGHPFDILDTGLAEIQTTQERDLAAAASDLPYAIFNVVVTGNVVTWDHVWTSHNGEEFCQSGHEAVVEGGKFVTWTWPRSSNDCP